MGTRVELRSVAGDERGWHVELARRLTAAGAEVRSGTCPRTPDVPRGEHDELRALLRTERLLHRVRPSRAARCSPTSLAPWQYDDPAAAADVVIDVEGGLDVPGAWQVTFDGRTGTEGALSALAAGRFPVVRVVADGRVLATGRPGSETPRPLTAALEDVLAGTVLVVEQAVLDDRPAADAGPAPADPVAAGPPPHAGVLRTVATAGLHRAYRAAYRAPHWRVGWRLLDQGAPDVLDLGDHPATGWSRLPDDGFHFYADPFPVAVGEDHLLFVEDFDHRVGRGVISVVEVDDDGPVGTPRPVLDHEVHLSYPYVIEDDGEWWMIPETSAAGTVELYRAVSFPDRWRLEAVLLREVEASDVSVVRHDGRWWMFATVRHGGSWSDALHLWSADRLTGPWRPHPRNPVLIDIAAARPAGRPVHRDGRLLRPVQDGRGGYGSALALAEVLRLDEGGYDQRVVARLGPGPRWPGTRLHTLNRAGRLETIDGSARSPRLWR